MYRTGLATTLFLFIAAALTAQHIDRAASPANLRLAHCFAPYSGNEVRSTTRLPDTVRLLAVMVEFKEDDDGRTSGTGKFGTIYEYDYGTEILDPMPHDRSYFQQHLLFLENYVRKASARRTILIGEVLDGIVTVPGSIVDYSFRRNESEKPVAELAVDAWQGAVAQFPTVNFSAYDMFVVFHAGRGRDIDLVSIQGFDPTPFDIPSLSFTLEGFRRLLGSDFSGIAAGSDFHITNCAVLPTTNNREISMIDGSRALLELTINGLLAASFGTYAGLPDLFNTNTGKTGIGRFGLMDGESIFAYGGICPPEPSAWEKQQLGWTVPRDASPGKHSFFLTASDTLSTPDVLRVLISDKEYWLIENRQRDIGGNGQMVSFVSGGQIQHLRFPKDTTGFDNGNVSALKGVVIDVEDIDWSLPGGRVIVGDNEARINGGLLIWHIDETLIEARQNSNTVNSVFPRGVDLEQAGGPQDIGIDLQTIFGPVTGSGSPLDYWTNENPSPVYANRFGMYTTPNTRANNGAFTHVTIDAFSPSGPIMSFDVALGDNTVAPAQGFPLELQWGQSAELHARFIQTADLDGDGSNEILVVADSEEGASLHIVRSDGTPLFATNTGTLVAVLPGISSVSGPPAIGDINGDGVKDIVVSGRGSTGDIVVVLESIDRSGDGLIARIHEFEFPTRDGVRTLRSRIPQLIHGALLLHVSTAEGDSLLVVREVVERHSAPRIPAASGDNPVCFVQLDGSELFYAHSRLEGYFMTIAGGKPTVNAHELYMYEVAAELAHLPAMSADVTGDGEREIVRVFHPSSDSTQAPRLSVMSYASGAAASEVQLHNRVPTSTVRHMSSADIDGDGRSDIVLSGADGRVVVLNSVLASVDHYPAPYDGGVSMSVRDGRGDRLFISGSDRLWQVGTKARQAEGFPIPLPIDASTALIRTRSGLLGVAAVTSAAQVFLFEVNEQIDVSALLWRSLYCDERNSLQVPLPISVPSDAVSEFFPKDRCYNWPNPVYDGITRIRFFVSEDSDVTVKIYDLAGDAVDELRTRAVGGVDNEIIWNVGGIQSDVYLARVEASAPGRKGEKIIKIAIVK